ncbi:protein serine/threonine phosphatase 2C family protein [bacterium]|nr:MAG: protein serine/threonine phosphatase 2C family protein [bacterium]QQR61712.1 MAG: protein serine/threonine phosphatase 2C family protein [bacterium]
MILHVCIVTMVFYSTLYTSFSSNTDLVLQSSNFKTDTGLWNAATGIMQGSKRIQEDVIAFETENEYSSPLLVAVCDGNGGIGQERIQTELLPLLTMKLQYQRLLANIMKQNNSPEALSSNIRKAFLEVNEDLKKINRDSQDSWYSGGSTALCLLSDAEKFWLAFCGDSLGIWKENGAFKDTISHHLAERTDSYSFSRSFGNFRCSLFEMTSEPDIYEIKKLNTDWLLLATDGLWTHTKKETVYNFIEANQKKDSKTVVHELSVLAMFHDISANYECNYMVPVLKLLLLYRYPFLSRTAATDFEMFIEKHEQLSNFLQLFEMFNGSGFDAFVSQQEAVNPLKALFESMQDIWLSDGSIQIEQIKTDILSLFNMYRDGVNKSEIELEDNTLNNIFDRYYEIKDRSGDLNVRLNNLKRASTIDCDAFNVLKYEILRKMLSYTIKNISEECKDHQGVQLLRIYACLPDPEQLKIAINSYYHNTHQSEIIKFSDNMIATVIKRQNIDFQNEMIVKVIEHYQYCCEGMRKKLAILTEKLMNGCMSEAEITHYSQLLAKLHSDNMAIVYVKKARENSVKKESTQKLVTEPTKNSWFSSTMSFLRYNPWNVNNDDETVQ